MPDNIFENEKKQLTEKMDSILLDNPQTNVKSMLENGLGSYEASTQWILDFIQNPHKKDLKELLEFLLIEGLMRNVILIHFKKNEKFVDRLHGEIDEIYSKLDYLQNEKTTLEDKNLEIEYKYRELREKMIYYRRQYKEVLQESFIPNARKGEKLVNEYRLKDVGADLVNDPDYPNPNPNPNPNPKP
jgi:hypothetical protein